MSYDQIKAEMNELYELEKGLINRSLESKRAFWKKVTDIYQQLSMTYIRNSEYEQAKSDLETVIERVKEFQAEKERFYIVLREQMTYNQHQLEKEIEVITTKYNELTASNSEELSGSEFYNSGKKLLNKVKTIRPLDKTVRAELLEKVEHLFSELDEKRKESKEARLAESTQFKEKVFQRMELEFENLKAGLQAGKEVAYDEFFKSMEDVKEDLSSEHMVKKHVDSSWKKWKELKETSKDLISDLHKNNYEQITTQLNDFVTSLENIESPKAAFNQYKQIQKSAIASPMKRRQKDKIFKRFKTIWADMQEKFKPFYEEAEKRKEQVITQKQKEAEKAIVTKERRLEDLNGDLKEHKFNVDKLKKEIAASESSTYRRKAEEVLSIQEQIMYEINKKIEALTREIERTQKSVK